MAKFACNNAKNTSIILKYYNKKNVNLCSKYKLANKLLAELKKIDNFMLKKLLIYLKALKTSL